MSTRVLPPGWGYMISIATGVLRRNLAEGTRDPMVNVKVATVPNLQKRPPHDAGTFRKVEILHPENGEVIATLCENYESPVPGSDGRGVCYITTTAPLRVTEGE